jgi:hypothetical protein
MLSLARVLSSILPLAFPLFLLYYHGIPFDSCNITPFSIVAIVSLWSVLEDSKLFWYNWLVLRFIEIW